MFFNKIGFKLNSASFILRAYGKKNPYNELSINMSHTSDATWGQTDGYATRCDISTSEAQT